MDWTWILFVLSLAGTVFNIYKLRVCFLLWFFSNCAWCLYNYHIGVYSQSALLGVYAGLAVWGWFAWKKKAPADICRTCGLIADCKVAHTAKDWGIHLTGCQSYFGGLKMPKSSEDDQE